MTQPTDQELDALIEAVERGLTGPTNWRKFSAVPAGTNDIPGPILAHRAYHGSLDAAKALHDELTPGSFWYLGHLDTPSLGYCATVSHGDFLDSPSWRGFNMAPARAWLLAILKAYRTQVTQ